MDAYHVIFCDLPLLTSLSLRLELVLFCKKDIVSSQTLRKNSHLFLASPLKILPCAVSIVKIEFCRHKLTSEVVEKKNGIIINSYLRAVDTKKMR